MGRLPREFPSKRRGPNTPGVAKAKIPNCLSPILPILAPSLATPPQSGSDSGPGYSDAKQGRAKPVRPLEDTERPGAGSNGSDQAPLDYGGPKRAGRTAPPGCAVPETCSNQAHTHRRPMEAGRRQGRKFRPPPDGRRAPSVPQERKESRQTTRMRKPEKSLGGAREGT